MSPRERLAGAARTHGPWVGVGAVLGIGFCAIWWLLVAFELFPSSSVEELVIPPGTADAIERGVPFAFVPERYVFPPGGRLRVINQDSVEHSIGGAPPIPAGQSADITATQSGQLVCTIHPSGHLEVRIESRPPVILMAGLVAMLGVGTATAAWVIRAS